MTITKRELLLAVVEHPGTDPGASRETHELADQLVREGWLEEAMGGFVPTAKALDEHPHFASQADIADPSAPAFGTPDSEFVQQATPQVTDNVRDRLAMLFICLLSTDLTLGAAYKAIALAPQLEVHQTAVETALCRELADRLLQGLPEPGLETAVRSGDLHNWMLERAEDAATTGLLSLDEALQAVREGFDSIEADRDVAADA